MSAPSPDRRELAVVLRELGWVIHRRAPERAGVGPIPTAELAMLKQVIDTPGSTIGQLANALGLRQPNASAAIKALADRGLVLKAASAEDRRVTRVDPTPLGRTEHAQIAADWLQPLEAAIEGLTHDHRHALEAATGALHELRLRMGIDRETRAPR